MNIKQFFWLFPFICFIAGYVLISLVLPSQELVTPSLIGKPLNEACTLLSENKLNIRILAEQEEPSLAPGTILNQMPTPGQKIKPHQSIFLVISRQAPLAYTPQLTGTTRAEIEKIAEKRTLTLQYIYVPNELPKNYCIAQYPAPESPITNSVLCYLADGKQPPVIVPNFINQPKDRVIAYLESQGITPEINVLESFYPFQQTSIIIDQRPLPGSLVILDPAHPQQVQLQVN